MPSHFFIPISPVKNLDELKLNNATQQQLKEIIAEFKAPQTVERKVGLSKRSRPGIKVLFHGSSGTGKSQAVAVIAKELNRPAYHIDLGAILGKYIGETKKDLHLLFRAAAHENAILFIDEAEALFGKRTNVTDAHDKYANQELSYLLGQIEEYNGLVILATNMKTNIDAAFMRRLRFIVEF
ncbi:MAG: ATP-binding protein [Ferruginibacter sp.]